MRPDGLEWGVYGIPAISELPSLFGFQFYLLIQIRKLSQRAFLEV